MSKTGQLTEYIQSNMSLMRMLEATIREHWTDVAYTDYGTDVHFTFAEVAKEIKRLHLYFEDLGLVKGDKIAICDKNSSKWAIGYLAALTYGAITVPILNDFNGAPGCIYGRGMPTRKTGRPPGRKIPGTAVFLRPSAEPFLEGPRRAVSSGSPANRRTEKGTDPQQ